MSNDSRTDDTETRRSFLSRKTCAGIIGSIALGGCLDRFPRGVDPVEDRSAESRNSTDQPIGSHEPMGTEDATFERLDRWEADGDTELTADTENVFSGSQSASVEGGSGVIRIEYPSLIDLSGYDISFAMDIERPDGTIVHLGLTDVDGNRTAYRSQFYQSSYPSGYLRYAPSVTSYEAEMSRIASIQLWIDADGEPPKYRVDDVRFEEKRFDRAKFVFTFDDVLRSQYETAYPIMSDYGFVGSLAVNTELLGENDRLTLEELAELDTEGWSIDNHTHSHVELRGLPEKQQRREIETPLDFLADHGFEAPNAFYYPHGNADRTSLEIVAEHHDIAYNAFTHWSTGLSPTTPMARYWTNRMLPRSAAPVERRIDLAIESKSVCTPYWHTIRDGGEIDPVEFEKICAYLEERSDRIDVVLPERIALD